MFGKLNLQRDPFSTWFDYSLHVESRRTAGVGREALRLLEDGADLWVKGPRGSGRESFVAMLAERRAKAGQPAATIGAGTLGASGGVLGLLVRNVTDAPEPTDQLEACELLYSRLLDGLWRGGALVSVAVSGILRPPDWEELAILADLSFLGRRLTQIVACGEGDAPLPTMRTLELASPLPSELADCLRQRLALCGGIGALGDEPDRLSAEASGYSDALRRAGRTLRKASFDLAEGVGAKAQAEPAAPSIFSPGLMEEVGGLLDAISNDYSS